MSRFENMKLPNVNLRRQRVTEMENKLHFAIRSSIEKVSEDNNYEFTMAEIDQVLLSIIKTHNERSLNKKFGFKMIS